MELRDTHTRKYTVRDHELAPDGQIFRKAAGINPPCAGEGPDDKRTSVPADAIFEFKTAASSDPFIDLPTTNGVPKLGLRSSGKAKAVLGQLIDYADLMFQGTFRTHAFMVFFASTFARSLDRGHIVHE
jgi:hypothetical protein